MIGWNVGSSDTPEDKGYGDSAMSLGDMMRGERATLGKSLLDVQRELKIKANYISAIEDSDTSAFETPGFIAGYVRSYARYLGMDPDMAFAAFCRETGFQTAHGMSERASVRRKADAPRGEFDSPFSSSAIPFTPEESGLFSAIEPRAIGSIAVLLTLISGLGYGGWTLLRQVQTVQFAPVEQTPDVTAALDPLAGGAAVTAQSARPSTEAFDRLYRPRTLDLPVMASRDAPIATLQPAEPAATSPTSVALASADTSSVAQTPLGEADAVAAALKSVLDDPIQVTEGPAPQVALLAVRPVWVRVRASDGSVILEKILDAGEEYALPATASAPTLRAGNSGSLFFRVGGEIYGPAGPGSSTAKNVNLDVASVQSVYQMADLNADSELAQFLTAELETQP